MNTGVNVGGGAYGVNIGGWMHLPGSMRQKTDGQQAGGTHPTGMHSEMFYI